MAKFVERDRSQLFLLLVDMREWVTEDDLAHFVVEAVDRVPMSAFVVNERGAGAVEVARMAASGAEAKREGARLPADGRAVMALPQLRLR